MSVLDEITRIKNGKADLLNAISEKGVSVSSSTPIEELGAKVRQISSGGNASQQLALRADGRITDVTAEELDGAQYIGAYMFYGCDKLIRLGIPDSVTSIKTNALAGIATYDIVLPNTMTSLAERAFWYCPNLLIVTMSSTMTTISAKAFQTCANLQVVDFSHYTRSSVPTLSATDAFSGCNANLKIIVPYNLLNSWKSATNWSTYSSKIVSPSQDLYISSTLYNGGYVVGGLGGCEDSNIIIPSRHNGKPVTAIDDDAFYAESVDSVIIPSSVTKIGYCAFDSCDLDQVILGSNVEYIDEYAFYNNSFESIFIPRSVNYIGADAFDNCTNLKQVDLSTHTTVPTLGSDAFFSCHGSLEIKVPANLLDSFKNATNWSVYATRIVKEWGERVIETDGSIGLDIDEYGSVSGIGTCTDTDIIIPSMYDGVEVTIIEDGAFDGCEDIETVIISDTIEEIWYASFRECTSLTSVTMGGSVNYIDDEVFDSCHNLMRVDFSKHTFIPYIGIDVFLSCSPDLEIKVPEDLYDEWIEDTNWCDYTDYIVTEFTN